MKFISKVLLCLALVSVARAVNTPINNMVLSGTSSIVTGSTLTAGTGVTINFTGATLIGFGGGGGGGVWGSITGVLSNQLDLQAALNAKISSPTSPASTNLLYWNGSAWSNATIGTGLAFTGSTLAATASAPTWGTITGTLSNQTDLWNVLTTLAPLITLNAQNGSTYTLQTSDSNLCVIKESGSAATYTVPTHASQAFRVGDVVELADFSSAAVTIAPAAGVTIVQGTGAGPYSVTQGTFNVIQYLGSDNWMLGGGSGGGSGGFTNPMTTLGDTMYGGTGGTATRLAGNTTTTKKYWTQTGNGSVSAAPGWNTIIAGDLPLATSSTFGAVQPDNSTITISGGVLTSTSGGFTFADSLANSSGTVTFVNDAGSPGNYQYYGTDSGGTKGYYQGVSYGPITAKGGLYAVSANSFASTGALTAGQVVIGQSAAVPSNETISGDASLAANGALTVGSIGGEAVTLAGTFTTSGAYATTFTMTGATGVTFPTSGTLATTAQIPATSGSSILYGNGSGGFSNVSIGANLTFSGGILSATAGGGSGLSGSVSQVPILTSSTTAAGVAGFTSDTSGNLQYHSATLPGGATITGGVGAGITLTATSGQFIQLASEVMLTGAATIASSEAILINATGASNQVEILSGSGDIDLYASTSNSVFYRGTLTPNASTWSSTYNIGTAAKPVPVIYHDHSESNRTAVLTIAAGTGAGSGATATIIGTDMDGQISVHTGTSSGGGDGNYCVVTFNHAYDENPYVQLTEANGNAATLATTGRPTPSSSTTTFRLIITGAPSDSTTYIWNYHVGGAPNT